VSPAKRFGRNLRRLRRAAGLSQDRLALRASVHRTQLSRMERGLSSPQLDTLVKLADSIGCSLSDLGEGIKWIPKEDYFAKGRFSIPDGR
jgi:transcriptional regulator with XRE-family HTH domain